MGQYLVHMPRTTRMSCKFLYCDHCEKGLKKTSPLLGKSMYVFWMRYLTSFIHQTELNCLGIRGGYYLCLDCNVVQLYMHIIYPNAQMHLSQECNMNLWKDETIWNPTSHQQLFKVSPLRFGVFWCWFCHALAVLHNSSTSGNQTYGFTFLLGQAELTMTHLREVETSPVGGDFPIWTKRIELMKWCSWNSTWYSILLPVNVCNKLKGS